jgi:hypothetical protein
MYHNVPDIAILKTVLCVSKELFVQRRVRKDSVQEGETKDAKKSIDQANEKQGRDSPIVKHYS